MLIISIYNLCMIHVLTRDGYIDHFTVRISHTPTICWFIYFFEFHHQSFPRLGIYKYPWMSYKSVYIHKVVGTQCPIFHSGPFIIQPDNVHLSISPILKSDQRTHGRLFRLEVCILIVGTIILACGVTCHAICSPTSWSTGAHFFPFKWSAIGI